MRHAHLKWKELIFLKRFFSVLLMTILTLVLLLVGSVWLLGLLFVPKDSILNSLPDYKSKAFYTCGGFQDHTDYAKYTYPINETALIRNPYFLSVTDEVIPDILSYIENFQGWVEICHDFPKEEYDFDTAMVEAGDYFYLHTKYEESDKKYWNYDLYYFDLDSGILYYFHNNL